MAISEKKMQIVIDNYFKSECDVNTSIRQAFEKGFRIGVKKGQCSQPKIGEWIPVGERLPEIHQDVLLELRSGEMLTGFKAETEPYFYCHGVDGCYVEPQNVLAWQPLPEPYKPEKDGENDKISD